MEHFEGTATARIGAPARSVFEALVDVERLPAWNAAIESVLERPPALEEGAEWVVLMHPRGLPRWRSRSRVLELDRDRLRFVHHTMTDDGNPSFLDWTWTVTPDGDGSAVRVDWDGNPRTWGRKLVGARIRRRGLAREVPASLAALAERVGRDVRAADR